MRPLSRTITARQSATPLGTQERPARHAELFALGTTDHRPHRLQKRETPGGKLKMMKAFPPGAISHPAARRETSAMLRRRKDGCQRNKFRINMCRKVADARFGAGAAALGAQASRRVRPTQVFAPRACRCRRTLAVSLLNNRSVSRCRSVFQRVGSVGRNGASRALSQAILKLPCGREFCRRKSIVTIARLKRFATIAVKNAGP